jgi:hypothetical protein
MGDQWAARQMQMSVLHKMDLELDIERETTALNTSFQEIQDPWILVLSLGPTAARYFQQGMK